MNCPECYGTLTRWRARVAYYGGNRTIQELVDGPSTTIESVSDNIRDIIASIQPIGTRGGGNTHGANNATSVHYLVGDERRAVALFIAENTEYVASCLETGHNVLRENWSDEMYQLLVEQWEWSR